jgi:transcriptional regulator with XRE-family HTH domain
MKNQENKAQFIGGQIKIAREAKGCSQLDLAKSLGFESSTAISLIESGERKVTVENLERIANFLNKDIKFFIGQDESNRIVDVKVALRADKDLTKEDQDALIRFIDLAKSKKHGK